MRLDPDQEAFRDAIRDFVRRECGTREQRENWVDDDEEDHSTPLYDKLAALGWLGVAIPEEFGGSGGTYVEQTLLFEELYRGLVPIKGFGASTTVAGCYKRFGSDEQKRSALADIAGGTLMAISISEPEAGSDVANISCAAAKAQGGYVLNGQKTWCSYAHRAGRIMVLARTSREGSRHHGLTLFEVPGNADGIETHRIPTLGGREVNDVFFTDCFVPEEAVVGEVGQGFRHIMAGLDGERLLGAAVATGLAQRALDDTIAYVKERRQFGKPISSFQVIQHRIADLATEIECSRMLTYELAARLEDGSGDPKVVARLASMAKIKSSETAKSVALEGMQMMGGYGYATEYDMEAHVRHALVMPIYAGANEVLREIIAGSLALR
ncbi:Acyl-CoA dehydrogenase [Paraconexibacter sp. AEG42_29]|uniref:Acyl-CoA dehydrogenase n=1 Tax=Paraconexibacter sp. AEG42_29 TaxID=2997339 RepID=A0AAU7B066_9ACTN